MGTDANSWRRFSGRLVFCGVLMCSPALAADGPADSGLDRLRSPDRALLDLLRDGAERSGTLKALIERLEVLRGIVYVTQTVALSKGLEGCLLHRVWSSGEDRYLRVLVRWGLPKDYLIALVAHELQHAIEVLEAPGAHDSASIERLFERIGVHQRLGKGRASYETRSALEVQDAVSAELKAPRQVIASRKDPEPEALSPEP